MELIKELLTIINEGLRGNWTQQKVNALKPAPLAVLKKNATEASDADVLDMIKNVEIRVGADKVSKEASKNLPRLTKDLKSELLNKVWDIIEDSVGRAAPDGDPIDWIAPKLKSLMRSYPVDFHEHDTGKWLDDATKHHNGKAYKDYNHYLADMWDSYNETAGEGEQRNNPWK